LSDIPPSPSPAARGDDDSAPPRLLTALLPLFGRLPLALLLPFGAAIGWLLWLLRSRLRSTTEINLARCLPELPAAERARLVRQRLVEFGRNALALLHVWFVPPARLQQLVARVDGESLIDEALAARRGVIVLGPHVGNWELVGRYLGRRYGITSMFLPNRNNPELGALVQRVREQDGATLVPADGAGVRALLKTLKGGGVVGVLPDQEPKQAGAEFAPFFGTPALTMTLISNLVQRTGARAVTISALRDGSRYRLLIREAHPLLYSADLAESLDGLNRSVEACARDDLVQYQWEYKRFRHQPPGVARPYP
jgi:KDO2-lipid IV(A) lauroyltransferase